MAVDKRKVQEINAGSMADIAFLLLIFFLVATTMNVDTGLARMLPPLPPENQKTEDIKVKQRNILLVLVNGAGQIMAGTQGHQELIDLRELKDKTKEFILNPYDLDELPEKEDTEIELPDGGKWVYPVSMGVVSLQTTRDTNYQAYIMVQNELTRAFNEVRDDVAMRKFGAKFADLNDEQRSAVVKAVPNKISEAEPKVVKKKANKGLPPFSTASLPDVIFMILFFFMVSTTMRDQELLVRYKLPEATEVQKLEKKSLVSYIHIGQPSLNMQAKFGTAPRIQLNDAYRTAKDIGDFVAAERDKLSEVDKASMTVCLKADESTKMGVITDVKQELRRANALKISYAASKSLGY